eukprot:Awhi_evm1s12917
MQRAKETCHLMVDELGIAQDTIEYTDLLREGMPLCPEPPPETPFCEDSEYLTDGTRIEAAFRHLFYR